MGLGTQLLDSAWTGLTIMIVSEAATLAHVEPFYSWNTPICWTGFILFADAVVWRRRHDSWLRSAPREFGVLAIASILLWLLFEGYNRIIDNWFYTGLPESVPLRLFGYAWSFATIWPAIFEGAELISVYRAPTDTRASGRRPQSSSPAASAAGVATLPLTLSFSSSGILMLAWPFFVTDDTARYLAAPVWLGFIFLLDPINARLGGESLLADFRAGKTARLINLMGSGFLCGVLWELWNFWSGAKWHYTVPIMERAKIFEMPLPGYLGFPAFALECLTMYEFVRCVYARIRRRVAPFGRPIAL